MTKNWNKKKLRIDKLLVEKGYCETRKKAQALILSGKVYLIEKSGENKVVKPGTQIHQDTKIKIIEDIPYVSRGGLKLESTLKIFEVSVKDKICLDIGASTGGFTHCLLLFGAKKVYALDVGKGQLHYKLRNHPKVVVMEKINARYITPDMFDDFFDLITIDVSFISLTKILPNLKTVLNKNGKILALIKPQFELTPKEVKKGVVKDNFLHKKAVDKIWDFAKNLGYKPLGVAESPILGAKGNKEFFIFLALERDSF